MNCSSDADSLPNKEFRRKRHRKQTSEETYVCSICGDDAASYNFGAICCESCKAFYRRSLTSQRSYSCASGERCVVNKQTRKLCPGCRMRKCCEVGMSSDPLTIAYIRDSRAGSRPRRKFTRKGGSQQTNEAQDAQSSTSSQSHYDRSGSGASSSSMADDTAPYQSHVVTASNAVDEADVQRSIGNDKQKKKPGPGRPAAEAAVVVEQVTPQAEVMSSKHSVEPLMSFSDEEYALSLATCRHFADTISAPLTNADLGPVIENVLPDDPVSLTRFPEATLRKYVSAIKAVPEFGVGLTQAERFWLLKLKLMRQISMPTAFFADPHERCFRGVTSTGTVFYHSCDYVVQQFLKSDADISDALQSMLAFYGRVRAYFPSESQWHIVMSYLSIVKFFCPNDLNEGNLQSSSLHSDVVMSQLLVKCTNYCLKYKAMLKHHVQVLMDSRTGLEVRSNQCTSRHVDKATSQLCESLLSEAHQTCEKELLFFQQLMGTIRADQSSSSSDCLIPLMTELFE